jgi:MFS transporter, AAHS family, 4-hydroxybenzoate transporter
MNQEPFARATAAAAPSGHTGTSSIFDLAAVIDARPVGRFQIWVLVLIGCSVTMDGFDLQSMGFVAPALVRAWGITLPALGPIFGAGLLGMLVGSLSLGVLADRIGRRPVLIGATLIYGLFMLGTAFTHSVHQMMVMRLLTGFGVGGVMGNAVSLATEYSPRRRSASLLMWISCGFTGGAILGGLVSALLIPREGWQSVFVVGGILPLLIFVAMYRYLPESLQFLATRPQHHGRMQQWLNALAPDVLFDFNGRNSVSRKKPAFAAVADLFRARRAAMSVLLWGLSFANLLDLYFLANWLPTLATRMGHGSSAAVLLGTTLQLGGFVGAIVMGPLIDRRGFFRILIPAFIIAAAAIITLGRPELPLHLLFIVVLITGVMIVGAQPAINVLAATLYPVELRATGVGWVLGIGRVGSIIGPVAAARFIAMHWSISDLFAVAAVPALVSCSLLAILQWVIARRASSRARDIRSNAIV